MVERPAPGRPDSAAHRELALWAAECADRVLPLFESDRPGDLRAREAIAAARGWARGEVTVTACRDAAAAAHAAAREATDPFVGAAARSAGHAAATAHMAAHAQHAARYALRAVGSPAAADERNWQRERLPAHLAPHVALEA